MDIGHTLLTHRRIIGYFQTDLAQRLGISQSTYSNWETNLTRPSVPELRELAKHLNISASILRDLEHAVRPNGKIIGFENHDVR